MKKLFAALFVSLLCALDSIAGNSLVITNLPALPGSTFQVNGLNATGQLTGYFSVSGQHDAHAFLYDAGTLTDLQTLGGSLSEGLAINSSGQIAGDSLIASNLETHALFFNGVSNIDLGALGGNFSTANGLNDAGDIIGVFLPAGASDQQAFIYTKGTATGLGTLGGTYSSPFTINSSGTLAGESSLTNLDIHAFSSSGGSLTDLGTLGGNYSSAFAINDSGVIGGESAATNGDVHGFLFSGGVMTDVGTLGGTYSTILRLNSSGLAIGLAMTTNNLQGHAVASSNGVLADLGTLGGSNSFAFAINNQGSIVGEAETAQGALHASLWTNGVISDLNDLLPSGTGWELASARFINDAGRIVGIGTNNGVAQWFILDPASGTNTPPQHEITVTPSVIWPPNHRLVSVHVNVDDSSGGTTDCKIISITANEPTFRNEIHITGDLTARLAAWRDPHGNGRVYTIVVRCTGSSGESTDSTVTVTVPKSQGKSKAAPKKK